MRTTDLIKGIAWRPFHGGKIQSPLRSLGWTFLLSATAILTLLFSTASSSVAGSAAWKATPLDINWNNADNWTTGGPPNGPADIATFATSNIRDPEIGDPTEVNGIVFNAGASAFTITSRMRTFTISGVGITNNSGIIQNFVSGPTVINFTNHATAGNLTAFTNTGDVRFFNSATAGNASFTNNAGLKFFDTSTAGNVTVTNNAEVLFQGSSTAGNGTFTNEFGIVIFSNGTPTAGNATFINAGGAVSGTGGGFTVFDAGSTAGNATVITNGATASGAFNGDNLFEGDAGNATLIANGGSNGGGGGFIQFRLGCTGGTARVEVFGNGNLDISQHDAPGVTTGSIEGNGLVFLGGVNLTVGANNLSTTFSGLMQDGGFSGGSGGSLAKIGTGTLRLSGANAHTGGTLINAGTLQASHDGALGGGDVSVTGVGATLRVQTGATNNYIADTATLSIVSGSTIDLNFSGAPDTILSLIVDGVVQPAGIYGSAASGAPHQLPEFAGTGEILVTTSIPNPTPTPIATATVTATPTASATATPTGIFTATPTVAPILTPSPTATATTTATPTATATTTTTATPTAAPMPTPLPTPIPTASSTPSHALNISTRLRVEVGDNVMIGGFIITGNAPKNVAVRGIGPSLTGFGISDVLADSILELRDGSGALLASNDDWQDDPAAAGQLTALGLGLQDPNESGIVATLQPGPYSAILAGKNGGTGIGLVEIYDTNQAVDSQLANISTRGFVQTGDNVMIGGFVLGGTSNNTGIVVRGIGPSLAQFGLSPVLANPTLEVHDGNGALLISNDDWQDDPEQATQLSAHGLAPQDPNESGIFASLPPGDFTAALAGKNGGVGIGLVEIYIVP